MIVQKAGKLREQYGHQQGSNKVRSDGKPGRSLKLSKYPAGAVNTQYQNVDSNIEGLQNRSSSNWETASQDCVRQLIVPTPQMSWRELVSQNSPADNGLDQLAGDQSRDEKRQSGV